ncbi:filamentous haemagglutinin family protein [Rhizobacter sp. P5_C2]
MTLRPLSSKTDARLTTRLSATAAAVHALFGLWLLGAAPQATAQVNAALNRALPNPCSLTNACNAPKNTTITTLSPNPGVNVTTSGNTMSVTQTADTALMNWRTFDVAAGNSVNFSRAGNQNFVAINRIHDTQASRIDGSINAPKGQIYLINPNGLLFGKTALVDVAGLIASTLDVADARVTKGLLGVGVDQAAFVADKNNAAAATAAVRLDQGAVVKAGNVYVFAPNVSNAGTIQVTPGGQVVLGAGQRVYLAGSDDVTLRGLLVEVGQGGTVTNTGTITTPRGNTTMVGMAVNQQGRITATSALNQNGSIRLVAREVVSGDGSNPGLIVGDKPAQMFVLATATGAVDVASGSTTEVLLDATDTATAALSDTAAAAARSTIVIDAGRVKIGGEGAAGSTSLLAHGGDIRVSARTDLGAINTGGALAPALGAENAAATLTVGADARLDVSGERNVQIDGNRNYVYIDRLTSNDLRDAPLQRDGFLRGQGVYLNVAKDQAFIDLSGRRAAVAGTQAERNAAGGNIVLHAEGSVTAAKGAQFDLSGGTTVTGAATGRTSQLLTGDGRVVDITNARADEAYVGFADRYTRTVDAPREGLNSSSTYDAPRYTTTAQFNEGRNAGSLEIVAPRGSFAATVQATTTPGEGQRANLPLGGEVRVGMVAGSNASIDQQVGFSRANVLLIDDLAKVDSTLPAAQIERLIALDTQMLRSGGVTRIGALSDGRITVARGAALDLGPGGSLSLQGNAVDVNASIVAHGGSLLIGERPAAPVSGGGLDYATRDARSLVDATDRGSIRFGSGVALDASGLFTNDLAAASAGKPPTAPIVRNGGSIAITGAQVDVSSVTRFDVDSGASVSAGGVVTGGKAGSVSIIAADASKPVDTSTLVLGDDLASRLSGFGFSAGGSLTLGAPSLTVGSQLRDGAVRLDSALFDRGFEAFTLRASEQLSVQGDTRIAPPVRQYLVDNGLRALADGSDLSAALVPRQPLPAAQRPSSLTLAAGGLNGRVSLEAGSVIDVGTLGSVRATAGQAIDVNGSVTAHGGSVSLALGNAPLVGPTTSIERLQQQVIRLGDGSLIDVSGVSRVQADALKQRSGTVVDGGSVSITATRGSFVMDRGARIVADGASDQVDLRSAGAPTRIDVASRGGAVAISAQQGLFVDGRVSGRSGGAGVEGGRLSVRFEGLIADERVTDPTRQTIAPEIYDALFKADRVLTLGGSGPQAAGQGRVQTALVNDSGFDTVQLTSTDVIAAPDSVALTTRGSITLDAPVLRVGADATLSVTAPTVSLGFQSRSPVYAVGENALASGGDGKLEVAARQVQLVGSLSLQGVGRTVIAAQDDVLLRGGGTPSTLRPQGSLSTVGDLTISAAQLTPASMTDYRIALTGPDTTLHLQASGNTPLEPLSAAGSVTLAAPVIEVDGRISAPQGSIKIDAGERVRLGAGAVLSVAGTQDVPLGTVFNGSQWVYADDPNNTANNLASNGGVANALPEKRIAVSGATVDIDPKARLDLSGGGNLVAQEFVAGPGGSIDVRQNFVPTTPGASALTRNPLFALVPARGDHAAPFDPQLHSDLTQDAAAGGAALLRIGQTITIGGGSGIPAGTYTVLPARYALLPGAYALQPVAGYADLAPGNVLREAAGTVIVAGRLGVDGAGASSARWSGYRVFDGTQVRRLAEFREYTGTALATAAAAAAGEVAPRTAVDAGALSIAGQQVRLSTDSIRAASTGRGAELSFSAPQLIVTDQPTAIAAAPSDTLVMNAAALSGLKAETLVLGAVASHGDGSAAQRGTLTLSRPAGSVLVGGTQALSAGELILTASGQVTVGAGVALVADAAQAPRTSTVRQTGDGASLYVSSADALPAWARSDTTGAAGDLLVAESARLSGRSVLFDGSRSQRYAPSVLLDAHHIGLSAARVSLGDVPADAGGLLLGNALLAQFNGADSFSVTSGNGFEVYGNAQVGSTTLAKLTLDGAGFVAHDAGASARITAGTVSLRNSAGGELPAGTGGAGTGTLDIQATGGKLSVDGGALATRGFGGTTLAARDALQFNGSGGFKTDGALTLQSAAITAGRGATQSVEAGGVLRTVAVGTAPTVDAKALGASLSLSGQRIEHGGRIDLPSGRVSLAATGTGAADDVTLQAGSRISVAGSVQRFGDQTADASAGSVALSSAAGSVRAQAGSTLDLNGAGSNGDAGALRLSAVQGTLQFDGQLLAVAGSAARSAEVVADVGKLPDLGTLTRPLMQATGGAPLQALDVRVRNGDLQLKAGESVSAHTIRLAADGGANATRASDGQLRIDGRLDAGGERAGRIELHARDSITLGSTARLDAASTGALEEGGSVLLSARIRETVPTTLDAIRIDSGARVDVGAASASLGGTVTLRAPRVGSDVAITALPADYLVGAREEIVEATIAKNYTGNLTLNASGTASAANPLPTLRTDLKTYLSDANRSAMTARLGRIGDADFHLRAGLDISTSGSITVANTIDFAAGVGADGSVTNAAWRYGGSTTKTSEAGALTLRAAGDVTLTGGLQDGFVTAATGDANARLLPYAGDSWRFQVTAGADRSAAAAATTNGTTGSVTLQPSGASTNPAIVRTGTGRIDIAAGKDIVLRGNNVAIYSGGERAADSAAYAASITNTRLLNLNPSFTEHGGGVTLEAGHDIVASVPSNQLINHWLWRAGRSDVDGGFAGDSLAPTAWWVNAATFSQGIGALGGGDLTLKAGNDLRSLTAAVPSNAHLSVDAQGRAGELVQHGGGTLDVQAGGRISGGAYYAQRGELNLRADSLGPQASADPLIVALGSNTARLQARSGAELFGAFNPTWAPVLNLFETPAGQASPANSAFTTYTDDSRLDLRSLTGEVSLAGSLGGTRLPSGGSNQALLSTRLRTMFDVLPPNADLVAFGGDVDIGRAFLLAPAARGQLRVLADGNVGGAGALVMAALDPANLPSVDAPVSTTAWISTATRLLRADLDPNTGKPIIGSTWGLNRIDNHGTTILHEGDTLPVAVIARNGDISDLRIETPKPLLAEAGGDIRDVKILAQNLDADSVTRLHAGGALTLSDGSPNVTVTGPGIAEVLAGGQINLGSSTDGLLTRGNLINTGLPVGGATLIVASGLGRGSDGFVQPPDYANVLRQFVAYDAFASTGQDAAGLNALVLSGTDFGPLQQALQDRSGALRDGSAFQVWLNALPAAARMRLALELAQRVQAVANQRFVATANTESFAPGYLSFHDLFPALTSNLAGLRQFVASNPFAGADNAGTLRDDALKGLPDALAAVLRQGLADPAQAADANSAFNQALAQLDPALLAAGSRQLVSQVQGLAGSTLDALRGAGRVGAKVGTPFAKGLDDLARAFSPAGPVARNDITLVFSQIKAEQSGDVVLLAPRGGVLAGLANPPAGVAANKQAYQLGVLTLGGGDILSMTRDNFDVYRSRVFTVAGGDVHLWASLGNIDAGRGPRDTVVAPPPRLVVDTDTGLVTLDVTASVSGSGIGALKTRDDQKPSDIRLIAPNGFIDAGEAGIRAETGTVTLGTNIVLNAGNIAAGGGVSGGAVVVAPPTPVPQSSNTSAADKAVEQTQKALTDQQKDADERAKKERRKRVTGEFIGFGDD